MHYRSAAKANFYDCDIKDNLKISAAMRYMQQNSSEQLELLGMPYEKLYADNMVFLMSKACIKVQRMPKAGEDITVATAPLEIRGARFTREFVIDSLDGERLISTLTLWVLVDPQNRRILRPSVFPYPLPYAEKSLTAGIIGDVKIPKPQESANRLSGDIAIRYSHIDCNGHVNNSMYADFICDTLPYGELAERGFDTLVIAFQNEAKQGDFLKITASELSDGEYSLTGLHDSGSCFEAYVKLGG